MDGMIKAEESDERLARRLRETGVVAADVLDELIEVRRACWKPFGRVAVELGYMKIVQVAKVLSYQAMHPDVSFGRAARTLGFLRVAQVEAILERQRDAFPSLAEVLVSEMVLEPGEVAELMHESFQAVEPEAVEPRAVEPG